MPVITEHFAVSPKRLNESPLWRSMERIDTLGGDTTIVIKALSQRHPEKLIYAEGDSWFDKFTPLPATGTNLLEEIKTPFLSAVVDVSHIGDEARNMVHGWQARQTKAMFDLFAFDAILLSAGGNDLKNLFVERFDLKPTANGPLSAEDLNRLASPASYRDFFAAVMSSITRFASFRTGARNQKTRDAPIFVHGYDYLQPRPAGASVFAGTRLGPGPWLYPSLKDAGLNSVQMRSVADALVDELNRQLKDAIAPLENVHVIDQRGLLTPAAPGSTNSDADWMDEIHPNTQGFVRLARNRWDVPISKKLGWTPNAGDLVPATLPHNVTTAYQGAAPTLG